MDVQYQHNQGGMDRREPNKHHKTSMWISFWNLLTILKLWFKNIDRATKYMNMPNIFVGITQLWPDFVWTNTRVQLMHSIEYPDSIIDSHRPLLHFGIDRPMESSMQHTCSCPICNYLDLLPVNAILVLCTNALKRVWLLLFFTIILEISWYKNSITQMIFFDGETFVASRCFHLMYALKCFGRFGRELTEFENVPTCMIYKQCTTWVALLFLSVGVGKSTRNCWDIMVSWHTVTMLSVIILQDILLINTLYLFNEFGILNRWSSFGLWISRHPHMNLCSQAHCTM